MTVCWHCEAQVPVDSAYCPRCGHDQRDRTSKPLFIVDSTTELFNAAMIQAIVGQEGTRSQRYRRPLSVLVVEVDHAEHIHLDLGSGQLDGLLKEMAEVLVSAIRDTDTAGFLDSEGPPHYAIVMPETDQQGVLLAADKIRRAVASHDFQAGGQWQRLTISCGAATLSPEKIGNQDLLREAYDTLIAGRQAGPNRTHIPSVV